MDGSAAHVLELHRKFEALNEDVSAALKHQREALAGAAGANSGGEVKREALRLATRAANWKEDVAALAKHIDGQLQRSRALREHHASAQLRSPAAAANADRQLAEDEGERLRCLRSDLRMLQAFRVGRGDGGRVAGRGDGQSTGADAETDPVADDTRQLQALLDESVKREKVAVTPAGAGSTMPAVPLAVELFERRRELMSLIAEDVLRDRLQREADIGSLQGEQPTGERDALAARDTQLFTVVELQTELRAQMASQQQQQQQPVETVSSHDQELVDGSRDAGGLQSRLGTRTRVETPVAGSSTLEEAQIAVQKLRRELAERASANVKLALANSQLEDDLAHLQHRFEDEKRAHLSGKKWFLPKLQQLEEAVLTTGAAFHEVKLSVDLVTSMYKTLGQQLAAQQQQEDAVKLERDRVSTLLSAEIKKVALLSKDNERKDKLVAIAMAARHEMAQHATRQEQLAASVRDQLDALERRAQAAEDEGEVLKQQLDAAYARVATTGAELQDAGERENRLRDELRVVVEAAQTRELELQAAADKQQAALQQRLDKTKRELMETMSTNLSLDSRLRKAQEKLARAAATAAAASSSSGDAGDGY